MSDLTALALTTTFALWFVGFTSVLVVNRGGTWVPQVVRQIASFSNSPKGPWLRRISDVVATIALIYGQAMALALVAWNWGRASVSVTLILAAEPVLAVAWTVYLARAASSRQVR
jgi:nitric oxide reductase large subunit